MFTTTLCGIAPQSVLPFIGSELAGCAAALIVFGWVFKTSTGTKAESASLAAAGPGSPEQVVGISPIKMLARLLDRRKIAESVPLSFRER